MRGLYERNFLAQFPFEKSNVRADNIGIRCFGHRIDRRRAHLLLVERDERGQTLLLARLSISGRRRQHRPELRFRRAIRQRHIVGRCERLQRNIES